jgi:hypothetical protein
MAIVLNEAIKGKQKRFARLGIAILFGNMVLFNLGVYNELVSNFVVYCGLLILAVMVMIRIGWFFKTKLVKQD